MKKSFFIACVLCFAALAVNAQDCVYYFPVNQGASVETSAYDPSGNLTGINIQRLLGVEETDGVKKFRVSSEYFEAGGKPQSKSEIEYYCSGGVFYTDMKKFIDPSMTEQYKDMEISVEVADAPLPPTLKAGDLLTESYINMVISNQGIEMFRFKVRIYNRKVAGSETITTSAGSFECHKITYDVETFMMFPMKTSGVEWVCKNAGVVKSETYDSNGKLLGYSLITKIKN